MSTPNQTILVNTKNENNNKLNSNESNKDKSNNKSNDHEEIKIGILGSVDSGKSTLTGVLTHDILDNGRGSARTKILKHPHELESGRTSCIVQYYIRKKNENNGKETSTVLVDLAGHEKYFKTTINGVERNCIDYACVVVGANMGILRMTIEHLILCLSLNIPLFIVITKIDICPENVKQNTIKELQKVIKRKTGNSRQLKFINEKKDWEQLLDTFKENNLDTNVFIKTIPVFEISSVKGTNLSILKPFFLTLPQYHKYDELYQDEPNFVIDGTFNIKGIGLVVSGYMTHGIIEKGHILQIGPVNGKFFKINIKSIHNNYKEHVNILKAGQGGCFNIKPVNSKETIKRDLIRKGTRIMKKAKFYSGFEAVIKILHHPTTIKVNYQPTIHCGTVCQTATICKMDKEFLRLGDKANVHFKFKYRNEYIEEGSKLIFREGKTKGIGKVISVF